MSFRSKYILLLILSPGAWWPLLKINLLLPQWLGASSNFGSKINSLLDTQRIALIQSLRWANLESSGAVFIASKFLYNKATILVSEFMSFLSFFSPRIYFQAGDGSPFSPSNVEPIPILLFPFWAYGIFLCIKNKNYRPIAATVIFALIAFLFGQANLAFLLPVLLLYVYFAAYTIQVKYIPLVAIYSIFIIIRAFL